MTEKNPSTPLMQQYFILKEQHPEGLLLFQVGDFYELFFADAQQAAAALAITLTARGKHKGKPIPLCGVPVQARDYYVAKLVKAGFKIIICDQLEAAIPGKVVARGVTQVLTPGTLTDATLLEDKSASYLTALVQENDAWFLVMGELLTGSLFLTHLARSSFKELEHELGRFLPDEIIVEAGIDEEIYKELQAKGYYVTRHTTGSETSLPLEEWLQARKIALDPLVMPGLLKSLTLFFSYLGHNRHQGLPHFTRVSCYNPSEFLLIDPVSQRTLELVANNQDGSRKNTLLSILDYAVTAMGSRLIKKWLLRPLIETKRIEQRYEVLELLMHDLALAKSIEKNLERLGDSERMLGRIALGRAPVIDYQQLVRFLEILPLFKKLLAAEQLPTLIKTINKSIESFSGLTPLLFAALETESNAPYIIKKGFDKALDEVRELWEKGTHHIMELEAQERKATGINSLKISYNSIQGYALEVTKPNLALVPAHYIRLQTLVNKERFTTPELKQLEVKLATAHQESKNLEQELFAHLKQEITQHLPALMRASNAMATLDALFGLWKAAYEHGYTRPHLITENQITITQGRHPVIERKKGSFIPNDLILHDQQALLIITGPNMGGKSTYLRQNALIIIMAQIGSFVPAQKAMIAVRDRIFTRIGASDNVAEGKSTFLVEMEETATICRYATANSLVILDEVGRGTSTFDGLAIAQAVLEYCRYTLKAPTLFATHYHELTALAQADQSIKCLHAESKKDNDTLYLTYHIKPGVALGSFGIEVAKVAGLPGWVIERAQTILKSY